MYTDKRSYDARVHVWPDGYVFARSFDATKEHQRYVFRSPKGNIDQRDTSIPGVSVESGSEPGSITKLSMRDSHL